MKTILRRLLLILTTMGVTLFSIEQVNAQQGHRITRIAKIQVDPAQLESFNAALKEQMATAVKLEPGVLTYYAVADKGNPSDITILEIYADTAAYQSHIQTTHFKKYKATVQNMVKSLELIDVNLISVAKKPGM
ncbi:putative quinol monooxygenase [Mucilaginibacter sp. BT774]|uniref:putative quinol monooxygenase n=1 Tax=Mucilaginibacter sp. BT774 TaxID=3062276 RepID=UPI002675B32A|nr:putative quinol monooxygenase [Mucilaginibacter sp. BT774]MDO3626728.1 putative quinol monooxygenase [Mucilaginibacter sp. BT774]